MRKTRSSRSLCMVALFAGLAACDVHDNTVEIPNAKINVEAAVDVNNVQPEQAVPLTLNVQNVYLIEPSATPPPEHANDACHIKVYLDDEKSPPLLVTAQTMISVKIPAGTKPGKHKLVCRVHKHDDTPTTTVFNVDVNVNVSATAGGAGGSTGTAGAPGAGGSTGTAGAPGAGGSTGTAGAPGAGGTMGTAGAPGAGGTPGAGGATGSGGAPGTPDAGAPPPAADAAAPLPDADAGA
jgi:hypothetical protein